VIGARRDDPKLRAPVDHVEHPVDEVARSLDALRFAALAKLGKDFEFATRQRIHSGELRALALFIHGQRLAGGPAILKFVPAFRARHVPPRSSMRLSCLRALTSRSFTVPGGAPVISEISSTV
jgi:hypothetical protein